MSSVRRVDQLSVFLENRAGQMALLSTCLAEAGVKIQALSVADTIEHGLVRLVVDNPDAICPLLDSNGFNCLHATCLAVELPNRIGSVAEFADQLADANVNIQYLYGSVLPDHPSALLIVRVLDLDAAEAALSAWEPS